VTVLIESPYVVTFGYHDSTASQDASVTMTFDAILEAYANNTPTLQSIGESLIPFINAGNDSGTDYDLVKITKRFQDVDIPLV
jgi:hypothetical protein